MTNRIWLAGLLSITMLVACNKDFLEVEPKGKLIAKETDDYNLLLNNIDLLNVTADTQVPMGDEVVAVEPWLSGATLRVQRLFKWADDVYEPNENNPEVIDFMKQVYVYNKVINEVMNSVNGTEQQKRSLKAEALAGRAWCYFMMVNYFGKPYDPATAASDLGCPISTQSDVTQQKFTRATVQEVYDLLQRDLLTAIPDLPEKVYWRMRMSKTAGEALLGKVYLTMGRFPQALEQLNNAFTDLQGASIPVRLYDYNKELASGGVFLPISALGPASPAPDAFVESIFVKNVVNYWAFTNSELVLSQEARALFQTEDLRLKLFTGAAFGGGTYNTAGVLRRMGMPGIAVNLGITLPDMLLMRAECKARTSDPDGARADLETLRARRIPVSVSAVPAGMTQEQLTDYVINGERVREFALTGNRWFDMRRMSVDPLFRHKTYVHRIYAPTGASQEVTLRPERFTLRYSRLTMDLNPGMTNNP
ncbi:RagB/SusD family nutrient uptake outer membrane protein [Chitinophaga sp. sic0106]|uniref:RagB/SusD family nutrient uptake outer membrane protein n=1 Tax=Chitinophaga sp. sic0106 TaxID=2854785 RepID=UPI001C45A81A|nr:RagB/SusD family nutrient uptake outer membrane protein [Chitinophaga sp. sic0106]MBV7531049.1 RagB/SusD family nutrient uptake outer membrane protein [Chitinophaga sp. sic0106]